jgi:hypothetical protein
MIGFCRFSPVPVPVLGFWEFLGKKRHKNGPDQASKPYLPPYLQHIIIVIIFGKFTHNPENQNFILHYA